MPKKAGMEKWKKKRRQEHMEQKLYRYYIFCEGQQTEPSYFAGFKKLIEENPVYKDMVLIEIEPCQAETMRVIGMAEDYIKKNKIKKGQIWCVYDKDIFKILLEYGNPKLAIRYAKRIIKDGEGKTPTEIAPGTKVYELVEELAKYLPEEFKYKFINDVKNERLK